jgi:hypothetical protein
MAVMLQNTPRANLYKCWYSYTVGLRQLVDKVQAAQRISSLAPPTPTRRLMAVTTTQSYADETLPDVQASSAAPCCAATWLCCIIATVP